MRVLRRVPRTLAVLTAAAFAATDCSSNQDGVVRAQDTILKIARQHYPRRTWGAACTAGSEQSISCHAVFSADVNESLTKLVKISLDASGILSVEGMKSGDFDFGAAGPAKVVDGVLVPIHMACEKPAGLSDVLPDFGAPQNAATFLALTMKFRCHMAAWDKAGGAYLPGGGFRVPG